MAELLGWVNRPFLVLGDFSLSAGSLILLVAGFVAIVLVARVGAGVIAARLLARTSMDRGVQYAIGRIVYYGLLAIGLMVALQTSGIQLGGLAVVLGALGVGIGFGLQNIVNNFVSGLILLVERPVQIGDWIEIEGTGGRVERIGARSTTIVTNDNVAIIGPNAELVTEHIINWSHRDPRVRVRVAAGVAYGSDLERVRAVLLAVAASTRPCWPSPRPPCCSGASGSRRSTWSWRCGPPRRRSTSSASAAI